MGCWWAEKVVPDTDFLGYMTMKKIVSLSVALIFGGLIMAQNSPKKCQCNYQNYEVLPRDLESEYYWREAKTACENLTAFGKSDWYLPNKVELQCLCRQQDEIGNFRGDWYWSSSEYDSDKAWDQAFFGGMGTRQYEKDSPHRVRCVRKY